jgi:hypothetical protein
MRQKMGDRPPEPPIEEQLATPPPEGEIPPFEPLLEEPEAIMEPPPGSPGAGQITGDERERVAVRAAQAAREGRITLGDYAELVETVTATEDRAAFDEAVQQIATPAAIVPSVAPTARLVSVMGGVDRNGTWQLPPETTVVNVMGGCTLDLRGATVTGPVSTIRSYSVMGGLEVRVPRGIRVELQLTPILGGDDVKLEGPPPRPDAPVIRLVMLHVMGGSTIKNRDSLGEAIGAQISGLVGEIADPGLRWQIRRERLHARHEAHRARAAERRARRFRDW